MLKFLKAGRNITDGDKADDKEFKLKDQHILTSNSRLFIKSEKKVRYIEYSSISDIEFLEKRKLAILFTGIALTLLVSLLQALDGYILGIPLGLMIWNGEGGYVYLTIGMLLMLTGFLWKELSIRLKVSNSDELVLSGSRSTLSSLARLVNERRSRSSDNRDN